MLFWGTGSFRYLRVAHDVVRGAVDAERRGIPRTGQRDASFTDAMRFESQQTKRWPLGNQTIERDGYSRSDFLRHPAAIRAVRLLVSAQNLAWMRNRGEERVIGILVIAAPGRVGKAPTARRPLGRSRRCFGEVAAGEVGPAGCRPLSRVALPVGIGGFWRSSQQ